jgi:hypothetical protein
MRLESLGQRHDAQIAKQWAVSLINHRSEKLATQNETAVRNRYAGLTWLDYQTVPVSHAHKNSLSKSRRQSRHSG